MAVGAYSVANTNATNITAVNNYAVSAYNKANNSLPLTGGAITGSITISQDVNIGYDAYDSAVVAADTEDDARSIHPSGKDFTLGWKASWVDKKDQINVNIRL